MTTLEFWVTICLGGGDGGDVCVDVDVTDEEYELLKQCCRDYEEPSDYEGLEDLCERVEEAARDESEICDQEVDTDIDYNNASFMISVPDKIRKEVEQEDNVE